MGQILRHPGTFTKWKGIPRGTFQAGGFTVARHRETTICFGSIAKECPPETLSSLYAQLTLLEAPLTKATAGSDSNVRIILSQAQAWCRLLGYPSLGVTLHPKTYDLKRRPLSPGTQHTMVRQRLNSHKGQSYLKGGDVEVP